MKQTKPEKVITIIHTGTGNNGQTNIGKERLFKYDLKVEYVGSLDSCQSLCYKDHTLFDGEYFYIIDTLQDVFFSLGALANAPGHERFLQKLAEQYELLKMSLDNLLNSTPLEPLKGFIKTNKYNTTLMQLRCEIRKAERVATSLMAENKLDITHINILNLLSDVVFALIWRMCVKTNSLEIWTGD